MINYRGGGKYFWQDGDKLSEFSAIIDSQLSGSRVTSGVTVQSSVHLISLNMYSSLKQLLLQSASQPASLLYFQPSDYDGPINNLLFVEHF